MESFLSSAFGASTLKSLGVSSTNSAIFSTDELELLEEDESLLRTVGFSKLGRLSSKSSECGLATVIGAGCTGTGSMLELEELWRIW